ncbi:MAG: hypothetical protein PUD15_06220 [Prevotella sp.]|nr:hypothetical protein [Prevotella sp.]
MKRFFLILLLTLASVSSFAQYNASNSITRRALVAYYPGNDGYYYRRTEILLDNVKGVRKQYAYDKSTHILYVLTDDANIAITLDKDNAKIYKKDRSIPQLKDDQLNDEIRKYTKLLEDKFYDLNAARTQFIQDSIAKAKEDSIQRVLAYQKKMEEQKRKEEAYKATHDYHWLPTDKNSLKCTLCDHSITEDSVFCFGIKNDSIYFITSETGDLDIDQRVAHVAKIPDFLSSNSAFMNHYTLFKDSLTSDTIDYMALTQYLNWRYSNHYFSEIRHAAPFGYFDSWGWDDEYSMVTFNFDYVNTNPKTIRYITVFFKITNDVGDLRCTGYFRGTGPLKQWESASWTWDNSSYFVSGDASNMSITKVVLTWMNGKKQVVSGRYLQFNDSSEDDTEDD